MAKESISDTAKRRARDLKRGYPTERGVVYPKDLDKLYKLPSPPQHKEATIRLGGPGKIKRVEEDKPIKKHRDMRYEA